MNEKKEVHVWRVKDFKYIGVGNTYSNTISGTYATLESSLYANEIFDYEENELMKAEALINTAKIDEGLAKIDAVRTHQGAGLAATSGTGLTKTEALEELRKERRISLFLRGLAFYDLRRMGYTDPVSAGGGRKGAWVLDGSGVLNTNATVDYSYLSYWDVPKNEIDFNPATSTTKLKATN
jgi:hypothetical protein